MVLMCRINCLFINYFHFFGLSDLLILIVLIVLFSNVLMFYYFDYLF